jgi:hypothetical protein
MYKLFKVVKEYEKIQVYSYLYIYNINKATLIEQYKEESLEHDINFDLEIFNNLIVSCIPNVIELYKTITK